MEAYLDHAADTPVRPEALEAMLPWLRGGHGNPTGSHSRARAARRAVDEARAQVGSLVGADPGEVVLTSGGTEADDLAVHGVLDAVGGIAVRSAVEHPAVARPVDARGGRVAPVGADGVLDLDALADVLDDDVRLVTVMAAANETGVVQPVAAVADLVARVAPGAVVHSDAVQAAPWLDLPEAVGAAGLVSVSAHKLGGPGGVGALVVRQGVPLTPRVLGGGQERGRRSGSHAVAAIVGFGAAAAAVADQRHATARRVGALRDRLRAGLVAAVPDLVVTGGLPGPPRLPNVVHVAVPGVAAEELLFLCDAEGVAASAGSSCASGALEPSSALAAMGVAPELAAGALRLSLGWCTTDAEVDHALAVIPAAVERLRRAAA